MSAIRNGKNRIHFMSACYETKSYISQLMRDRLRMEIFASVWRFWQIAIDINGNRSIEAFCPLSVCMPILCQCQSKSQWKPNQSKENKKAVAAAKARWKNAYRLNGICIIVVYDDGKVVLDENSKGKMNAFCCIRHTPYEKREKLIIAVAVITIIIITIRWSSS